MIRFRSLLILAFFLPSILHAQGVQYTHKEAGDGGTAVPYPLVTVCTSGAAYTPLPCTPKASIYSDAALTVPLANPFRGDMFGNIEFYATPAAYVVSVTAPYSPGYSFKMSASGGFAGAIATTQVAFGSAVNTIAGSPYFTWNDTTKSLTVYNTGTNTPSLIGSTQGATASTEGILGQCQQLANFICQGGQFLATDSGAGAIGTLTGSYSVASHSSAGTLGTLTGVDVSEVVGGGAGAITTSRGIHVGGVSFPTGTSPTTHDGIKIDDQCAGSFPATTCIGLNVAAQSNGRLGALFAAPVSVTSPGTFANADETNHFSLNINSLDITTEITKSQGSGTMQTGLTGATNCPVTMATFICTGTSGFVLNGATTPNNNAIGGYFQGRAATNNSLTWGSNSFVMDTPGLTVGVSLNGNEVDVVPLNVTGAYNAVTGLSAILGSGSHAGTYGSGFVATTNVATTLWGQGFRSAHGAAPVAFYAGKLASAGVQPSQDISLVSNNGGADLTQRIFSPAIGDITLVPQTGRYVIAPQFFPSVTTGTAPFVVNSTTPVANLTASNHPLVEYCGATSGATQACAKTQQTATFVIYGDVTLNTATSQSITTLPFTNALYSCSGSDLTTAAGIVSFNTYANASVTIVETGGNTTDHLRFMCVGN